MKLTKHRTPVTVTTYALAFDYWRGQRTPRRGSWNADPLTHLRRSCRRSLYMRAHHEGEVNWGFSFPCDEDGRMILDSFTNECDCGRDYNMGGQLLAPRDQWGEETGETAADLIGL